MVRLIILCFIFVAGCAPAEIARLVGVGVEPFKQEGKVYSETFPKSIDACYNGVLELFEEINAKPYRGSLKKGFLVALNFQDSYKKCGTTTEAAVFFQAIGPQETLVEVSSQNYSLSEFVAQQVFNKLAGNKDLP